MKIKTSDLTGDNLGYAVALIENPEWKEEGYLESVHDLCFDDGDHYAPWKNWTQGGPIIEREEISISREFAASKVEWAAWTPAPIRDDAEAFGYGPTPLIAAMRCYVASKLGDEVEVPEELQ